MSETINLIVEASGGKTAKVLAEDFLKQTFALLSAVKETAKIVAGDKADNIRYRIDQLNTQSPLQGEFRGEVENFASPVNFSQIHTALGRGIEAILNGTEIPITVNAKVLHYLKEFSSPLGGSVSTNRLRLNGSVITLGLDFRNNLSKVEDLKTTQRGMFVKGMIEAANIHAKSKTFFYLYPVRGDRIKCNFSKDFRDKVMRGFGNFVRVHGDFTYEWREHEPSEIKVTDIEMLPDREQLPDIRTLFGAAPDATGDLTTEQFIEDMRYG